MKVTNARFWFPVTVQVHNNQLSFDTKEGVHSTLNVFAAKLPDRPGLQTFGSTVSRDFRTAFSSSPLKASQSSERLSVAPGPHVWDILIIKGRERAAMSAGDHTRLQVAPLRGTTKWRPARCSCRRQQASNPLPSSRLARAVRARVHQVVPRLEGFELQTTEKLGILHAGLQPGSRRPKPTSPTIILYTTVKRASEV